MALAVNIEITTYRLTADCSTLELDKNMASALRIELRLPGSKSGVLPLDETEIYGGQGRNLHLHRHNATVLQTAELTHAQPTLMVMPAGIEPS